MGGRYRDLLEIEQVEAQTRNEVGDLVGGKPIWVTLSKCREEPAKAGAVLSTVNAKAIEYSSNIFLPKHSPAVPLDARVRVLSEAGEVQVIGSVLRYKKYQHYAKIWV